LPFGELQEHDRSGSADGTVTGILFQVARETKTMVERRIELKRRYHRKKKLRKLKARLAAAKDSTERRNLVRKIKLISPHWTEPGTQPQHAPAPAPAKGKPARG
jgi:hypothetical protein